MFIFKQNVITDIWLWTWIFKSSEQLENVLWKLSNQKASMSFTMRKKTRIQSQWTRETQKSPLSCLHVPSFYFSLFKCVNSLLFTMALPSSIVKYRITNTKTKYIFLFFFSAFLISPFRLPFLLSTINLPLTHVLS